MTRAYEYDGLARHLCGIGATDIDTDLDGKLYDLYGVDLVGFAKLAGALMPLAAPVLNGVPPA